MYIPAPFEQTNVETMQELMCQHPLATLVTLDENGADANHIPLHYSPSPEPYGVLRAHIDRANPLWRNYDPKKESLEIFHGEQNYVTPAWYASKQVDGKAVPTWNYMVVHAYGYLRVIDDPVWILAQMNALTQHNEASFPHPWSVSDAPKEYVDQIINGVVGIELVITRLLGKWKLSQNQTQQNKDSLIEGLNANGRNTMAESVKIGSGL